MIFGEVSQWRDSGHAVGDPGSYLDQIQAIRLMIQTAATSYKDLFLETPRSEELNEACEEAFTAAAAQQ